MPVREQQEEERHGQHHDRYPARRIEREQHEAGLSAARVEQVLAYRSEDRGETEERPDPDHQPPEGVLRAAHRQHVPDHREHRERQDEADIPERVAGAGRTDRGGEDREHQSDREAGHRDAGQDPRKEDTPARTSGGDRDRELASIARHAGMLALERGPAKGPDPAGRRRASLTYRREASTPPGRGSGRWRRVGWWMKG
jgi:hypothetical protein